VDGWLGPCKHGLVKCYICEQSNCFDHYCGILLSDIVYGSSSC